MLDCGCVDLCSFSFKSICEIRHLYEVRSSGAFSRRSGSRCSNLGQKVSSGFVVSLQFVHRVTVRQEQGLGFIVPVKGNC